MELLTNLPIVNVEIEDGKATVTFVDQERGEIREIAYNTKSYDEASGKFIVDAEKEKQVREKVERLYGVPFDQLGQAIDQTHDVYAYDKFNSLEPVTVVAKFDKDMVGQIIQADVTSVEADNVGLHIQFEYEGDTYQSNMNYANYMEATKEWFQNPQKRKKQEATFEKKFDISVDNKEELVGKQIMAEVKDFNGNIWIEIKAFPKKKK